MQITSIERKHDAAVAFFPSSELLQQVAQEAAFNREALQNVGAGAVRWPACSPVVSLSNARVCGQPCSQLITTIVQMDAAIGVIVDGIYRALTSSTVASLQERLQQDASATFHDDHSPMCALLGHKRNTIVQANHCHSLLQVLPSELFGTRCAPTTGRDQISGTGRA